MLTLEQHPPWKTVDVSTYGFAQFAFVRGLQAFQKLRILTVRPLAIYVVRKEAEAAQIRLQSVGAERFARFTVELEC